MSDRTLNAVVRFLADKEPMEDEEGAKEEPTLRDVEILAYTGDAVELGYGKEVIDLAGLDVPTQTVPLLLGHDVMREVGYSSTVENDGKALKILGKVFLDEDDGARVAKRSDQGFPWQASIRVAVGKLAEVDEGEEEINGRPFAAPFAHIQQSTLKEVSFVSLGADPNTSAIALAEARNKERSMADKAELDAVREQERTRVASIREAFPEDLEFALDHIGQGSSVEDAKLAYSVIVQERLAEERQKRAEVEAELEEARKAKAAPQVPFARPGQDASESDDVVERFMSLIDKQQELHRCSRADAVMKAAIRDPKLHRDYLDHNNQGVDAPKYFETRR